MYLEQITYSHCQQDSAASNGRTAAAAAGETDGRTRSAQSRTHARAFPFSNRPPVRLSVRAAQEAVAAAQQNRTDFEPYFPQHRFASQTDRVTVAEVFVQRVRVLLQQLDRVLFVRTQCRFDDRSVFVRRRARDSSVRSVSVNRIEAIFG